MSEKIPILGMSRVELTRIVTDLGLEPFRVPQIWKAIYGRGATCFEQMATIARSRQVVLANHLTMERPIVVQDRRSTDDTRKWLIQFTDAKRVETVFIPEQDRGALCISSQAGCTLTCRFCHTGTMTMERNLTAGEIVAQVLIARDALSEWGRKRSDCLLTNVVMMGMGEPLFNFDRVAQALRVIMDPEGIAISRRRIMLSTAGVVPLIHRVGRELGVNLAISLHAVRDDLRNELVPLNRKYPIQELLQACRDYPAASNARRITFEYVMLKGVNDSDADAHELARLLNGIHAKVNLIPWNPWPGADFQTSPRERILAFAAIINSAGYSAAVRATRGEDILAACGQLKSEATSIVR
jgi:23S rRNA (adenine2503-C2)-methyltransferase